MKFKLFAIMAFGLTLVVLLAGCGKSLQEKIEQAKGNEQDERRALKQAEEDAQVEYQDEWQEFRVDAMKQIEENSGQLDELTKKAAAADEKTGTALIAQVDALSKTNHDLQDRLNGYKDDGKLNWDAFKRDFTNDIEGLRKTLKGLSTDSK
jgi:hypothetical protein